MHRKPIWVVFVGLGLLLGAMVGGAACGPNERFCWTENVPCSDVTVPDGSTDASADALASDAQRFCFDNQGISIPCP
jgi:hypothetical protein